MAGKGKKEFQRYLLRKGVIDESDLHEAESMKQDTNISLGIIAINRGMLTPEQVKKILLTQKKAGQKFGQAALQMKLLKRSQISELLAEQEKVNLDVGELLVLAGRLSFKQLEKERRAFTRRKK